MQHWQRLACDVACSISSSTCLSTLTSLSLVGKSLPVSLSLTRFTMFSAFWFTTSPCGSLTEELTVLAPLTLPPFRLLGSMSKSSCVDSAPETEDSATLLCLAAVIHRQFVQSQNLVIVLQLRNIKDKNAFITQLARTCS